MARIDTSRWKCFAIGQIFDVIKGTRLTKANMKTGNIRFIGSSAMNNGCTAMVGNTENMHPANKITVCYNGSVGETFYQDQPFLASDDVNVLYPKFDMTKEIALFIVPLIKTISTKYNYVDKWKQEVMVADEIMLPCTGDGEPDCDYMSSYMKKILEESKTYIEKLNQVKNNKELINVTQWQRFHLYDDELFDIDMGTKMDKAKMTELNPKVNFVGRANNNNGITARIDKVEGVEPYEAGNMTLSLGGEYLGSCFIQPDVFYTSQNVVVLIPKWKMSFGVKQFISAMIFKESRLYYKAFVDELNRHIKTDFSFLLPVKDDGKPDWSYMEQYMRNMMNVSEKVIENLGMLGL